jgi:hypothetical protein
MRKGTKGQPLSTAFLILAQYGIFGSWEGKYWWSEGAPKGNRNRRLSDNCLFERVRMVAWRMLSPLPYVAHFVYVGVPRRHLEIRKWVVEHE